MTTKTAKQVLAEVQALLQGRKFTGTSPAVRLRQRVEETIVLSVAIVLLDAGYQLGVNDGEEITIHHSRDIKAIQNALFTTDEDYLYVYVKGDNRKDPRPQYWVRCIYGNDGWDVISDYSLHLDNLLGDLSVIDDITKMFEQAEVSFS